MAADPWTVISALGAATSAGVAAWQIRQTRLDANRREVFSHLREIDARLKPLLAKDVAAIQSEILKCYRERNGLSDDATQFLSLLTAIDLLAFARRHNIADRSMAHEYVRTLLSTHVVSLSFLDEFQECCGDKRIYEHLRAYVVENRLTLQVEVKRA